MLEDALRGLYTPQEINPFAGENLNEKAPGEGFSFGGNEYKMFGPPVPTPETQLLLGYTTGNPLPVTVTNLLPNGTLGNQEVAVGLANQKIPNGTIGNYDIYAQNQSNAPILESPADRINREYEIGKESNNNVFYNLGKSTGELLGSLTSGLNNLISGLLDKINGENQNTQGYAPGINNSQIAPVSFSTVPSPAETKSMTTALNIDMKSAITLTVDGRTLATIIKPYFYQDMIRFMSSANSTINRSVLG